MLEGLEGKGREARRVLLERLADDGVPLDELRTASAEGRLALLPVERVLEGDGERYTRAEIAERSGLDDPFLRRLWRAQGMAAAADGARVFTEGDLEAARRVREFREAGIPDESIFEISRVMSRSMVNVASAMGSAFGDAFVQAGDTEHDVAVRYAEASRRLVPMLGPVLEHVLNIQQRSLIRSNAVDETALATGRLPEAQQIGVFFADLVGFTQLGETVDAVELGAVAERLEELAGDLVEPPVRVVKTIGDAVMVAAPDADRAIDAALSLVEATEREPGDFPQVRVGLAFGEAIGRAGDWFGRPVNLASRITAVARPSSVLADADVEDAASGDWQFKFARKRALKGIEGERALFRVRRTDAGSE